MVGVKRGMKKKFKQCSAHLKIQPEQPPDGAFVQVYFPSATGCNQQMWPHFKGCFSSKTKEVLVALALFCLCFSATSLFYGWLPKET